jgi:hypothetical protein
MFLNPSTVNKNTARRWVKSYSVDVIENTNRTQVCPCRICPLVWIQICEIFQRNSGCRAVCSVKNYLQREGLEFPEGEFYTCFKMSCHNCRCWKIVLNTDLSWQTDATDLLRKCQGINKYYDVAYWKVNYRREEERDVISNVVRKLCSCFWFLGVGWDWVPWYIGHQLAYFTSPG